MSDDAQHDWAGARGIKWREYLTPMEAMLAPINAPLCRALDVQTPLRIADIGCGGGATARYLAAHAPAGSTVHGVDVSPPLIAAAEQHGDAQRENLRFVLGDAERDRTATPYDRLCSRFGVMFFEDPPAAFANLHHWLAPGGRFTFAVWGPADDNPWMGDAQRAVQSLVDVEPPPPDAPGAFRYADEVAFAHLLKDAGFSGIHVNTWRGQLAVGGGLQAEDAARFALSAFSVGEPVVDTPELFTQAVAMLGRLFTPHEHRGKVHMPACVHLVSGGS